MQKILYIGRFELPDKEATAQRVIANAKLLSGLGYEIELAGWSDDVPHSAGWRTVNFFGFCCYEKHKAETSYEKYIMFSDASLELQLLEQKKYHTVIAYNFPASALQKILKYCRSNGIRCIGDVTEWYANSNKNYFFRIVRAYDSFLRMRILHRKMNGLFVISKYLQAYYSDCHTVLLPPLIDKQDPKWHVSGHFPGSVPRLVYAGWPSRDKERLDLIVKAVLRISPTYPVKLDVVGLTKEAYQSLYALTDAQMANIDDGTVCFRGRVSHIETLAYIKEAAYSVIVRQPCRKNDAGFPSKLVESLSCGTPVLTTAISNVTDYVGGGNNGYILSLDNLEDGFRTALDNIGQVRVNTQQFDYRQYTDAVKTFLTYDR